MNGDDSTRQLILRHLEPVLDRDIAGASRVLGTELPTSSPELNPGEAPECAGAPRLVPLAPLFVLALEQTAGLVPPRKGCERVHDSQRRLPHQQFAADGAREIADPYRKIFRYLCFAGEPTEDG